MNNSRLCLLIALFTPIFAYAASSKSNSATFVTSHDLTNNTVNSGIYLRNNQNTPTTVYGLYVRELAYVTPGDSCDHATVIYSDNKAAGSFVMPTIIYPTQSATIGANYIYNMLFQAFYYESIIIPSSPPGCALPGCTWGSDTTIYDWCIKIGALAPATTNTGYSSTVPPSTEDASGAGYNYNLISSYVVLGPISCNDGTLSCTVATQQTQSFS